MRASALQLREKRTRQQEGSRPASSRGRLLGTSFETRGKRKLFTNSSSPTSTGKRTRTEGPKTFSFASTDDYFALKPRRAQDEPLPNPRSDQHLLAQAIGSEADAGDVQSALVEPQHGGRHLGREVCRNEDDANLVCQLGFFDRREPKKFAMKQSSCMPNTSEKGERKMTHQTQLTCQ